MYLSPSRPPWRTSHSGRVRNWTIFRAMLWTQSASRWMAVTPRTWAQVSRTGAITYQCNTTEHILLALLILLLYYYYQDCFSFSWSIAVYQIWPDLAEDKLIQKNVDAFFLLHDQINSKTTNELIIRYVIKLTFAVITDDKNYNNFLIILHSLKKP